MRRRKYIRVRVARDARTGQFVPLRYAARHPSTTIVQSVKRRVRFRHG